MTANPYEGTEFWQFRHALGQLERLRAAALDVDLVWVLPEDVMAGAVEVYGLRVIRADVPAPLLAHYTAPPNPPRGDSMFDHTLRLVHNRNPMAATLDEHVSTSRVDVEADSTDLTEAWRELLSRLPSDVYATLKVAVESLECDVCAGRDDVTFCQSCMRGYAPSWKWQALEQQIPPGGAPVQFE